MTKTSIFVYKIMIGIYNVYICNLRFVTMVNTDDFIGRLKIIMAHHKLSSSSFAEKINVQRSNISHILSGRNKPSLDFVLKITHHFAEVDLYWLLYGKGVFPKKTQKINPTLPLSDSETIINSSENKSVQRVIIFYKDGTFEEFKNQNV